MGERINKSINNRNKEGISLVVLVITIIVLIIITSVVVFGAVTLANNGKKAAFATDLKSVEGAVAVYYNDNGTFPTKEGSTTYTLTTLTSLAGDGATELEGEIAQNLDTSDIFYEVDLAKINSTSGTRGRKENGENDIFVVSSKNMIVYYVKGEKIGSVTYFSLTDKLIKSTNIKREEMNSSTIGLVVESQGIKLTKSKRDWTNSLVVKVETILQTGETLGYTVVGKDMGAITITEGKADITLDSSTITGETLTAFNTATNENKIMVISKKNASGGTMATATISISNLDLLIGALPTPTVKSYEDKNILDFTSALLAAGESGIREIRYEYITKFTDVKDGNGNYIVYDYYGNQPTITKEYMLNSAKKQTGTSITIPKNVKSLAICMVDKSGNISNYGDAVAISDDVLKAAIKQYTTEGLLLQREIVRPTTNVINATSGTVEAWVNVNSTLRKDVAEKYLFSVYSDEKYTNTIAIRYTRDKKWQAIMSSDYKQVSDISVADTLSEGWHLFSIKWSSTEFSLYIDGVKQAYKTNPTLITEVPSNFNIGVGPRLNLVDNGYVTSGDNSNFSFATYTAEDYYSAPGSLFKQGNFGWTSNNYIEVDTNKTYSVKGVFKSFGVGGSSKLYYGLASYDADKLDIYTKMACHYAGTETILASDLKNGDQVVYLNSVINWSTGYLAIYNYKSYEPYTYTRNTYIYDSIDTTQKTIHLSSPYSGGTVVAGTKVANSYDSGTYIYLAAGNASVPLTWTTYSANICGVSPFNGSYNFRPGTKYIRMLMLLNYGQTTDYSTRFDDIEFIDTTKTLFNTRIRDLCISSIARSDVDILKRYKEGVLTRDSNVTYMLTGK